MRAVLALDLQTDTTPVLAEAVRFAERLDATLDLLFVDGLPYVQGLISDPTVANVLEREAQALKARNEARLRALVANLPDTVQGEAITRYGTDPARSIADLSADHDLLLVATHGRQGLQHLLLGSVAEQVLRLARVPTLVLRF